MRREHAPRTSALGVVTAPVATSSMCPREGGEDGRKSESYILRSNFVSLLCSPPCSYKSLQLLLLTDEISTFSSRCWSSWGMCGQGQGQHLRGGLSDEEADMGIWEKSIPGRNSCTCGGPEVGMSLAGWRNRQRCIRLEQRKQGQGDV